MVGEKNLKPLMALLLMGVLMGALDLAIVGPALPAIQAEFGLSSRALAWLFNLYVLGQLVGTPILAKLSDRIGPRPVYISSTLLFALGSLLLVIAPGTEWLFIGRAVQGFGAAGIFPVAVKVIGDVFPPEKRGGALGLLGAVFGLAFLIGPDPRRHIVTLLLALAVPDQHSDRGCPGDGSVATAAAGHPR